MTISFAIIVVLSMVLLSYRQTIALSYRQTIAAYQIDLEAVMLQTAWAWKE